MQKSKPVVVQEIPSSAPVPKLVETLVEPIQEPLAESVASQSLVQPLDAPLGDPLGDPVGSNPSSTGGDVDLFGGLPSDMNAVGPASNSFATPQQFSPAPTTSSSGSIRHSKGAFISGLLLTIQTAVRLLTCLGVVAMVFS